MTENQILILGFVGFWIFASILTYILLLKYTRKEYKKFYPHPIVNIVKDLNSDNRFKFWEKLFIFTGLNIVYLPIICEWLIAWCLYKFWKFIYVVDTIEQKAEEEMKRVDEEYQEKVNEGIRTLDEAINNPEANPDTDNYDENMSSDFLESIKLKNNENDDKLVDSDQN